MLAGVKKIHDLMKQKLESWRDFGPFEKKMLKEVEISTGLTEDIGR